MGYWKNRQIEQQDRGYQFIEGKYVCSRCFADYAIKDFVELIADEYKCDYCGRTAKKPIAADMDEVLGFISAGIKTEWGDPNNEGVGWEGGWQGADVIDSYYLFREYIEELDETNEAVMDAIVSAFSDSQWCQRDPYGLPPDRALVLSWEQFSDQVKHKTRYVFFRLEREEDEYEIHETVSPSQMLDKLSQVISDSQLIAKITPKTPLFRARAHKLRTYYRTAKDLGTSPQEKAVANRMSPAGIPMFYASFDVETALQEIRPTKPEYNCASIGVFKPLHNIRVLELTKLKPVPSIFDEINRRSRAQLMFMHSFVRSLKQPIEKDDGVHIEYVPTQVFTEYIRYLYADDEGLSVNGIVYPSARTENGISIVLFYENGECCDKPVKASDQSKKHLQLLKVKRRKIDR